MKVKPDLRSEESASLSPRVRPDAKRRGFQFEDPSAISDADLNGRITRTLKFYLCDVLGRNPREAEGLIQNEIECAIPVNTLNYLSSIGINPAGKRVLDLGAGLGGLSVELTKRGAQVFSIEPGEEWRLIVRDRLANQSSALVIGAVGERLPFEDQSFDLVVSLQVLEHVQDPEAVLKEAFRVCRPGGYFFLSCENYLSFREPHYMVAWFPMLPKFLGRIYLRARGRSPEFLDHAITYTTVPRVVRGLKNAGFIRHREREMVAKFASLDSVGALWKRATVQLSQKLIPKATLIGICNKLQILERTFENVTYELVQRPARDRV